MKPIMYEAMIQQTRHHPCAVEMQPNLQMKSRAAEDAAAAAEEVAATAGTARTYMMCKILPAETL